MGVLSRFQKQLIKIGRSIPDANERRVWTQPLNLGGLPKAAQLFRALFLLKGELFSPTRLSPRL